jgi:hypothetical protein
MEQMKFHAIAWQALSKLSAAEDIRFTSAWSGCASFNWLQNTSFAFSHSVQAIRIQTCQAETTQTATPLGKDFMGKTYLR